MEFAEKKEKHHRNKSTRVRFEFLTTEATIESAERSRMCPPGSSLKPRLDLLHMDKWVFAPSIFYRWSLLTCDEYLSPLWKGNGYRRT